MKITFFLQISSAVIKCFVKSIFICKIDKDCCKKLRRSRLYKKKEACAARALIHQSYVDKLSDFSLTISNWKKKSCKKVYLIWLDFLPFFIRKLYAKTQRLQICWCCKCPNYQNISTKPRSVKGVTINWTLVICTIKLQPKCK